MIGGYLLGALRELAERLVWIKSNRPRSLDAVFDVVSQALANDADRLIAEVEILISELESGDNVVDPNIARQYCELKGETEILESTVLPAIINAGSRDLELSRLLRRICDEIQFPLQCPAVTLSSQESFWILKEFHLLATPFREDHSPLHVPAMVHELGHILVAEHNDSLVECFSTSQLLMATKVLDYFSEKVAYAGRRRNAESETRRLKAWRYLWVNSWLEEFICDAFAAAVCGPSYAWCFVHSSLSRGGNAFEIVQNERDISHPADAARLEVVLAVVKEAGWSDELAEVSGFWEQAMQTLEQKKQIEFEQCYPVSLLEEIGKSTAAATRQLGCHFASPQDSGTVMKQLLTFWKATLIGRVPAQGWMRILMTTSQST